MYKCMNAQMYTFCALFFLIATIAQSATANINCINGTLLPPSNITVEQKECTAVLCMSKIQWIDVNIMSKICRRRYFIEIRHHSNIHLDQLIVTNFEQYSLNHSVYLTNLAAGSHNISMWIQVWPTFNLSNKSRDVEFQIDVTDPATNSSFGEFNVTHYDHCEQRKLFQVVLTPYWVVATSILVINILLAFIFAVLEPTMHCCLACASFKCIPNRECFSWSECKNWCLQNCTCCENWRQRILDSIDNTTNSFIFAQVCISTVQWILIVLHVSKSDMLTRWEKYNSFVIAIANSGLVLTTYQVFLFRDTRNGHKMGNASYTLVAFLVVLQLPIIMTHLIPALLVYCITTLILVILLYIFVKLPVTESIKNLSEYFMIKAMFPFALVIVVQSYPNWIAIFYRDRDYWNALTMETSFYRNTTCYFDSQIYYMFTILNWF